MVKYIIEIKDKITDCMNCKFHKCSKEKANVYCRLLDRNLVGGTTFARNKDCPLIQINEIK